MSSSLLPETAKKNIEVIAQVEQKLQLSRTAIDRLGDAIARFFGSLWFIAAHAVFLVLWFAINSEWVPELKPFDPYPFAFLGLIIGIEFIVLTSFVLMNQSVQTKRLEHWGHVTLQVCLLTEQEVTKSIQLLHKICERLDIENGGVDEESKELSKPTHLTSMVEEIEKARESGKLAKEE